MKLDGHGALMFPYGIVIYSDDMMQKSSDLKEILQRLAKKKGMPLDK
jgi:hypothetical protein